MIKPGQLVRIGSHIEPYHMGLVIKSLSASYTNGFTSVDWWYVHIQQYSKTILYVECKEGWDR
jgi:hypothetical protein